MLVTREVIEVSMAASGYFLTIAGVNVTTKAMMPPIMIFTSALRMLPLRGKSVLDKPNITNAAAAEPTRPKTVDLMKVTKVLLKPKEPSSLRRYTNAQTSQIT